MNPYKRFSVTLATALLVSTVLVATAASVLVQQFFIRDTAAITRTAVEVHFRQLFGFDLFSGGPLGEHAYHGVAAQAASPPSASGYGAAAQSGYGKGGSSYGAAGQDGAPSVEALDAMVRLHFDLYDVIYTAFYRPDGAVVFSYLPEEIGTMPFGTTGLVSRFQDAFNYEVMDAMDGGRPTTVLRQYLPLRDEGALVGIVQVQRDVSPLLQEIRLIQLLVGAVVLLVFAGLFFALRRIYLSSTRAISSQSRALSAALDQLNATYDATLQALSAALDSRDSETEGHALRVVAYAARLSVQLGLDQKETEVLLRGALLHDVGKIGISDAILRKKGPLTEAEWAEMRQHPEIGYNMLREIPFLADALPVVLHHHERFDGTGYPHRLKGTAIPLGARIFSVIDTLDAITADRPYRRGRTIAEAQEEIRRCAGSQFDPRVVEAFLAVPESDWVTLAEQVSRSRTAQAV